MDIDYKQLADRLLIQIGAGVTTKAVGTTPTAVLGHGPGGLFSSPGMDPKVFSAMVLPVFGLQTALPVYPNRYKQPQFSIFTGVTATGGVEPDGVCDDAPTTGLAKLCSQSYQFGRQTRMTRVFDIDSIGALTNRGEMTDLQLIGNPFGPGNSIFPTPPTGGVGIGNVASNEVAKAMFEFAVGWARDFSKELYTGNPSNNTTHGGRKYFRGLDLLINTGYQDDDTAIACPAADSDVRSFNSVDVNSAAGSLSIVRTLTNIYRNLRRRAQLSGLDPVQWAIVMPWSLFYEISQIWPQAYYTWSLVTNTNSGIQLQVPTSALVEMRDAMRGNIAAGTGQYLPIDGQNIPVILDNAVTETVLAGASFTSTIYFVPLTVLGATPVLYLEYFPYDGANGALEFARVFAPGDTFTASDGGRFMWLKKPPSNFCVQVQAKTEPRLILRTPYLAARLTSVKYTPVAHEIDGYTDSSYYVNGGRTGGTNSPSYFPPTP